MVGSILPLLLPLLAASLASASLLQERQGEAVGVVHQHEHDNSHKHKQRHYNKHGHTHKQTGKHIHNHEHVHNHQHVHDHGHEAEHNEEHAHTVAGEHRHKHWRLYRHSQNHKEELGFEGGEVGKKGNARRRNGGNERRALDHQVKSVNEYIGDSGKELEGAAEQIVESYMGEYMQEYMKGWYQDYCAKTGQFCDQVEMDHGTKDPKTGDELTYEVSLNQGVQEEEGEEKEDTVFSEEEQRLVKESVQRMHERLLSKKRRRASIKRQRNQQNIGGGQRLRKGLRGRSGRVEGQGLMGIRRVGLPVQDQGYRPINQVLLD